MSRFESRRKTTSGFLLSMDADMISGSGRNIATADNDPANSTTNSIVECFIRNWTAIVRFCSARSTSNIMPDHCVQWESADKSPLSKI